MYKFKIFIGHLYQKKNYFNFANIFFLKVKLVLKEDKKSCFHEKIQATDGGTVGVRAQMHAHVRDSLPEQNLRSFASTFFDLQLQNSRI